MATHKSAAGMRIALDKRFAAAKNTLEAGFALAAKESQDDWNAGTGGSLTPRQTKGAYARATSVATANAGRAALAPGELFTAARRGPKKPRGQTKRAARLPLLPINKQAGTLRGSLKQTKRGKFYVRLESTANHWKYLKYGTNFMVARPLADEIFNNNRARLRGVLRGAGQSLKKKP